MTAKQIYLYVGGGKDHEFLEKDVGQVILLTEIGDNLKIEKLLRKEMFKEASYITKNSNFPPEVHAEICKEHADYLYKKNDQDLALEKYIETIGFLNPSYVIQKYIELA